MPSILGPESRPDRRLLIRLILLKQE